MLIMTSEPTMPLFKQDDEGLLTVCIVGYLVHSGIRDQGLRLFASIVPSDPDNGSASYRRSAG